VNYLLDTCLISELVRKRPARQVVDWVRGQNETSLYLSVMTLGEIRKGIEKLPGGEKRTRLGQWVDVDLRRRFSGRVLDVTQDVAERWGIVSATAEKLGRRISVIDALLAATAQAANLRLVTRNTDDFKACHVDVFDPWC
jgi:hypothetical protein